MKKLTLKLVTIILLTLSLTSAYAQPFFRDIIVTSPDAIWTDSRAYSTLNDAIAAVGTDERVIKIVTPQVVTDLTVPSNVTLEFERDGAINHSGTLTLNTKKIRGPDRQIFISTGDIIFTDGTVVRSSWFEDLPEAIKQTNGATERVTLVVTEESTIDEDVALGDHTTLKWEAPYNRITANLGFELTNIKNIEAGNYQLFTGSGDFDFLDGTELNLTWLNTLAEALVWIDTEEVTLVINDSITVSTDETIDENIKLKVKKGALITISAGKVLTFNDNLDTGIYQVFAGTGTISGLSLVYPNWFGSTYDDVTLQSAIDSIGASDETTLYIPNNTWTCAAGVTFTDNITIKFARSAIISPAASVTVTIEGDIDTGLYQIFDVSAGGSIAGLSTAYPQWFGAVADGVTDNRYAINAAKESLVAGGVLAIPATEDNYLFNNDSGLTDAVEIDKSLIIQLDGTIESTYGINQVNPPFIFNVTADNVSFRGSGGLKGPGTFIVNETTTAKVPGLLRIAADDVSVDGLTFTDPPECAILITAQDKIRITNNNFTGGPLVAAATSPQHYYILAYGGEGNTITGNMFYADASGGACRNAICYGATVHARGIIITDNYFNSIHEHATYLVQAKDSVVSNNVIKYEQAAADQKGSAMKVGGQRNTIIGNVIYNAVYGGITAYAANNVVISNNELYGIGFVGIYIGNNVADAVGFSYNIIDGNILHARTDGGTIYEGIRYSGKSDTTAHCVGGKVTNNLLYGFGNTSATSLAAISVYHSNTSYTMIDFDVSHNKIIAPVWNGIYLFRVTKSTLKGNTFHNPKNASSRAIVCDTTTYSTISGNMATDSTAVTANLGFFVYLTGSANSYINLVNNEIHADNGDVDLGANIVYNVKGHGNRLTNNESLTGTFTMNGVSALVVNNGNICVGSHDSGILTILLFPLNAAAATIQGSVKSLYIYDTTIFTSFEVRTADGSSVAAANAIFGYQIIQ